MAKIVELVNREHFAKRSGDDVQLGYFLYDQIKSLLDLFGEQVDHYSFADILYFSYRESGHERIGYKVSDEFAELLWDKFLHKFKKEIEAYGKRKVKEGTNVLFALNSGALSMKDFNDHF